MYLYLPVFLCLFESFRRDLNVAKAVYMSEYYLFCYIVIREFKQIATAGATTAAVTEKVWGEYVLVVCQILAKRNTKMSET